MRFHTASADTGSSPSAARCDTFDVATVTLLMRSTVVGQTTDIPLALHVLRVTSAVRKPYSQVRYVRIPYRCRTGMTRSVPVFDALLTSGCGIGSGDSTSRVPGTRQHGGACARRPHTETALRNRRDGASGRIRRHVVECDRSHCARNGGHRAPADNIAGSRRARRCTTRAARRGKRSRKRRWRGRVWHLPSIGKGYGVTRNSACRAFSRLCFERKTRL